MGTLLLCHVNEAHKCQDKRERAPGPSQLLTEWTTNDEKERKIWKCRLAANIHKELIAVTAHMTNQRPTELQICERATSIRRAQRAHGLHGPDVASRLETSCRKSEHTLENPLANEQMGETEHDDSPE